MKQFHSEIVNKTKYLRFRINKQEIYNYSFKVIIKIKVILMFMTEIRQEYQLLL
jgi:hypothetical protein